MLLSYKHRVLVWQIILVSIFILIWGRILNLQFVNSKAIIQEAKNQLYKKQLTLRGDIRDRNGSLLVLDVITYELYNNTLNLNSINEEKNNKLAELLKLNPQELKKRLQEKINSRIFSGISETTANKIKKLNINFAYLSPKVTRVYPHKKMAAHVLGFVNLDQKGQHGIEYYHEGLLTKISESTKKLNPFLKGTDLVLTIDSALQEYTEEELNKAIQKSKAQRGSIIVLSPKTGEIFAWAVHPNYDPNLFFKEKSIKNWSITDIYEPGSTFKIITISSALENMVIDKNFTYYDIGSIKVGNKIIRNHNKTKPKQINLLELFKQSSNVASAYIALLIKPEAYYNSIKKFMIAKKTNIDVPGESEGLLLPFKKWRKLDLATTAFGQGAVSVTPLQLACAVSAIANHGIWTQPHVLKGIWLDEYKIINKSPYNILSKPVVSQEVADFISSLLKESVKENLKSMAYIGGNVPGYEVAGKTGTAQKIRSNGGGYLAGHTVASFIGYFPADDPEILALVVIDDPKTEGGWGNTISGPIFNNVAKMAAKRILNEKT